MPAPWQAPPWQAPPWQPAPWQPAAWQSPAPWAYGPPAYPPPWVYGPPAHPPPYPPRWLPPGTPPHDEPQPFLHAMRTRTWAGWRPAVGLLLLLILYLVAAVVTFLVGMVGLIAADAASFSEADLDDLSGPGIVLVTNLVTAVAIPVIWLVWVAAHGMRIGWSSSVLGRLRWRLLPWYTLLALGTLGVGICVSLALALTQGWEAGGPVASYGWLLVVVFLTTPLQAAAEEYVFRGYLSQAVAGWVRRPASGAVLAALVSGTLFSFAHLPPDVPSFLYYFFVGLACSAVVWLTGGLEAAIALHTVNNVVIFVLAGALGEDVLASSEAAAGVPWFDVVLTLLAMGVFVALVARSRGRLQPETQTPAVDLRPRPPAVPATAY
jgi:membrane protease YdiL (CAAX protease family)